MQSLVRLLRKSENKIGDCKVGAGHQNPGVLWEQAVRLWGAREVFPQDLPKTPLRHEESSRRVVAPKSINGTFPTYQNLGTSNTLASFIIDSHRLQVSFLEPQPHKRRGFIWFVNCCISSA